MNREQRRVATRATARATPTTGADDPISRMPAYFLDAAGGREPGEPVTLGRQTYHLAVLTSAGTTQLQRYFAGEFARAVPMIIDRPGIGDAVVVNVQRAAGAHAHLRELLSRIIAEPLPENVEYLAAPSEIAATLDAWFAFSGLSWMAEILKNSLAPATKAIQEAIAAMVSSAITETLPAAGGSEPSEPSAPTGTVAA